MNELINNLFQNIRKSDPCQRQWEHRVLCTGSDVGDWNVYWVDKSVISKHRTMVKCCFMYHMYFVSSTMLLNINMPNDNLYEVIYCQVKYISFV